MTDNELDDAVRHQVGQQPDSVQNALAELLREEPEVLIDLLKERGYLTDDGIETNEAPVELTDSHRQIAECLSDLPTPRTAKELVEYIQDECPSLAAEYQSVKHRPWLSTKLNELVETGELGRFRDGRKVKYTSDPTDAVRHWALQADYFPEDLASRHIDRIVDETDMPRGIVIQAVEEVGE